MGKLRKGEFLTFDDILIRPARSRVEPREGIVETTCPRGLFLKLTILSAAMDRVTEAEMAIHLGKLGGLGVIHRNNSILEQVVEVKKAKKAKVHVAAACGPFDVARAEALKKAGADVVVIDCAHGHNARVVESAKKIKKMLGKTLIVVGNVATREAAEDLVGFADAIKVGMGPGSICTTRVVSGVGVPQLSAIMEVASVANKRGVPIIADGGIRSSGDIAKAIAAGASAVMLGNLLAGTTEAPGKIVTRGGKKFKEYRGMGSRAVLKGGKSSDRYFAFGKNAVPEGVSGLVPYKGHVEHILESLVGGLKVSMGYVGAKNIKELQKKAVFIQITKAGVGESRVHSLSAITDGTPA